jgi:hypothetical protein
LPTDELARLLRDSYDMVFAKLPKKARDAVSNSKTAAPKARGRKPAKKKRGRSR